jgi:LPS-assembly protein
MIHVRVILLVALSLCWAPCAAHAQRLADLIIEPLSPDTPLEYDIDSDTIRATNGVIVRWSGMVLTANSISANESSGDITADGKVRIQQGDQLWASEHIRYNFKTRDMQAAQFRTGKTPVFAAGEGLHADITNQVYSATNAMITADDISHPAIKVRAQYIRIVPGKRIEAHHATLYLGGVPVFYFPFYARNIGPRANNFNLLPGYRSRFGPFLLGSYQWFLNEQLDGVVHVDYRERRGPGAGPDLNLHLGEWGDASLRYYYTHDKNPNLDLPGASLPEDRQRVYLGYQANPATNLYLKSLVRYESDRGVVRDFFEGEYRKNPQPSTFVEANQLFDNFSLDFYAQPRVNNFLETVERLPDIRLTGFRQEIGSTPLYYESESSAGYYRRLFADTNGPVLPHYEAGRADTYHQLIMPQTLFGWLNIIPRAGGRFTWYSEATGPGATTDEAYRGVFNTGAEINFKLSRLWPQVQSGWLDLDGVRHILEPSFNYVYVPRPNYVPSQLPQFDSELPSLRLLPMEFPDYNAIDSIDSQNVLRLGLRNKIQTKRRGAVVNVANWDVYTDWRLQRRSDQGHFADLYSDLVLRPRSWISFESLTRYDVEDGHWRLSLHTLSIEPNEIWSYSISHWYLRDDPQPWPFGFGQGNNLIISSLFLRFNENWGFRATQHFEARDGRMEEQYYTVYRDLRSWTAALTFRVRDNRTGPNDYTIAFTFSLKAAPRFGLGSDTARPYPLLGG